MQTNSRNLRRGVAFAEVIVAAVLLISGISLVGQMTVANGRLLQQSRHERLALDELTNQLERLTALQGETLQSAIDTLSPSPAAMAALPKPTLTAELVEDDDGNRLTLRIQWDRPQSSTPIALTGWLPTRPVRSGESEVNP